MSIARPSKTSVSMGFPAMRYFSVTPSKYSMAMNAFPLLFSDTKDHANIGVIQRGGSLGLALKSGEYLRVASNILRQELEGDEAMQPSVLSLVHHTHTAATKFLDDAVV